MAMVLFGLLFVMNMSVAAAQDRMPLAGMWRFQLDPMGFGRTPGSELYLKTLPETICLPGSTDEAGKGIPNAACYVDRLSRRFEYCGPAWYQRDVVIPETWKGKEIILNLERCHWETSVYVDGHFAGTCEHLSVPDRFVLTEFLSPGVHTLSICVDNRLKYPMDQWNHGTTEHTQTNWNGIVGDMSLVAHEPVYVRHVRVDASEKGLSAGIVLNGGSVSCRVDVTVIDPEGRKIHSSSRFHEFSGAKEDTLAIELALDRHARLWDEFSQPLYRLHVAAVTENGTDEYQTSFGFRDVTQGRHHIRINGRDVHLRGVLDCAVFPLTGYPSTDPADWQRIMQTIKDYGMNHVRFHSWCPPEVAFETADRLGLYLQVELPMWIKDVGRCQDRRGFFEREMYAILDEYGNHPSFVLYCNGNENEGDFAVLEDLIEKAQVYDGRRLYSASTARTHVASDQFYVSHVTDKGRITVYEGRSSTDWDLSAQSDIDVPVIAHETGQRCMYPDFNEMEKYTGVLEPRNFFVFRERLAENGMLHQADDFFRATGAHTVLQYKEVNEALLRTPVSGGFQLLGLADFPGQGSSFVGILDAFWEAKGLVTPEKFRESCAPRVLLARFPKRIYAAGGTIPVMFQLYNFDEKDTGAGTLSWKLTDEEDNIVCKGRLRHGKVPYSCVDSLASVGIPLRHGMAAGKYTLHAMIDGGLHNQWDFWIYPSDDAVCAGNGNIACTWSEAKEMLRQGKDVLLIPEEAPGRKTKFTGHFWNPIMFNWDPMIIGTLIDDRHPAFTGFPTSYYADWQWMDILDHAVAMDLTELPGLAPVIQIIDSYETNRKLGVAFEARVGDGCLFVLCVDVKNDMDKRPATCRLLHSITDYVASDAFCPEYVAAEYQLDALFGESVGISGHVQSDAVLHLLNK